MHNGLLTHIFALEIFAQHQWSKFVVFLIACCHVSLVVICLFLWSLIVRRTHTDQNTLQRSTFLSGPRPPTLSVFVFLFLSLLLVSFVLLVLCLSLLFAFFSVSCLCPVSLSCSCLSVFFFSFSSLCWGLSLDSLSLDSCLICVLRMH